VVVLDALDVGAASLFERRDRVLQPAAVGEGTREDDAAFGDERSRR
jgi:hypothetical protein